MAFFSRIFGKAPSSPSFETTLARAVHAGNFAEAGKLLKEVFGATRSGVVVPTSVVVDATKAKDGIVWVMFALKAMEDYPARGRLAAEETVEMVADADGDVVCSPTGIICCAAVVIAFVQRVPDLALEKDFHRKVAPALDALLASLPRDVFIGLH